MISFVGVAKGAIRLERCMIQPGMTLSMVRSKHLLLLALTLQVHLPNHSAVFCCQIMSVLSQGRAVYPDEVPNTIAAHEHMSIDVDIQLRLDFI